MERNSSPIKFTKDYWRRHDEIVKSSKDLLEKKNRLERNNFYFFTTGLSGSYKYKVLDFLFVIYPEIDRNILIRVMEEYILLYMRLLLSEGSLNACRILHKVYGICQRYSTSSRFDVLPYRKSYKDGLPKMVSFARDLLRGKFNERRAVLIILEMYSMISNNVESVDTGSISIPDSIPKRTYEEMISSNENYFYRKLRLNPNLPKRDLIEIFAKEWDKTLEMEFPDSLQNKRIKELRNSNSIVASSKSGPNGQAVMSLPLDYITLDPSLRQNLRNILEFTDNQKVLSWIEEWEEIESDHPVIPSNLLEDNQSDDKNITDNKLIELVPSRLRIKNESGGKGRLFAIVDGLTQNSLCGLHNQIFKWLSEQPEDGTSSHNYVAQIAKQWSSDSEGSLYSKDLTTASDRLPVDAQFDIQKKKYGSEFAANWVSLLTNRKFRLELKGQDLDLMYQKGQPMGAKSSWGAMAELHHLVVQTCQRIVELPRVVTKDQNFNYARYLMIGDDFATRSRELSELYTFIMVDVLECMISDRKGFGPDQYDPDLNPIPDVVNSQQVIEIAKRIFVGGRELTTVSPVQILDGLSYPENFPELLRVMDDRQTIKCETDFPAPILAKLHTKRNLAILTATLPIGPAPLTGVAEFLDGNVNEYNIYLSEVLWYKELPLSVDLTIKNSMQILKSLLQSSISNFYEKVNMLMSFSDEDQPIEISERLIPRVWYEQILDDIHLDAQKKIKEILLKGSDQGSNIAKNLLWSEDSSVSNKIPFKKEIGRLQSILELEKILDTIENSKRRRQDEKKFSSKTISKIVQLLKVDFFNLGNKILETN